MENDVNLIQSFGKSHGTFNFYTGRITQCPVPKLSSTNFISEEGVDVIYYIEPGPPRAEVIKGCLDPTANNYNPYAQESSGDCIWLGCTDTGAINYNEKANTDDGSCIGKTWVEEPNIDVPDYYVPPEKTQVTIPVPIVMPYNIPDAFTDFCSYCSCCFKDVAQDKGCDDVNCTEEPYTLTAEQLAQIPEGSRDIAIALAAQGRYWSTENILIINGVGCYGTISDCAANMPEDKRQVFQDMLDNYERDRAAFEEDQARMVERENIRDLMDQGLSYYDAYILLHPETNQQNIDSFNYTLNIDFLMEQLGATREQAERVLLGDANLTHGLSYDNIKDAILSGDYFGQGNLPFNEFLQNVGDYWSNIFDGVNQDFTDPNTRANTPVDNNNVDTPVDNNNVDTPVDNNNVGGIGSPEFVPTCVYDSNGNLIGCY